jgi:hypothetical protein
VAFQKGHTINNGRIPSDKTRQKMSAVRKGRKIWSDEQRAEIAVRMKGNKNTLGRKHTPTACKKISEARKGIKFSEEHLKHLSESHRGHKPTKETCQRLSEANMGHKSYPRTEEWRKMRSEMSRGEKSYAWRGGISFEPYCPEFNRNLKERVRDAYGRRCYLCLTTEEENKRRLSIHHNDYNKMQGCGKRPWNLLPLCHRCHARTNGNRWYWFSLLYNYWAMNPEINFASYEVIFLEEV